MTIRSGFTSPSSAATDSGSVQSPQAFRIVLVEYADHVALLAIRLCTVASEDLSRTEKPIGPSRAGSACRSRAIALSTCGSSSIARVEIIQIPVIAVRARIDEDVAKGVAE